MLPSSRGYVYLVGIGQVGVFSSVQEVEDSFADVQKALAVWIVYITVDSSRMRLIGELSLVWGVVVFNAGCLYAIYRALRVRAPQNLLLGAACAAVGELAWPGAGSRARRADAGHHHRGR